MARTVCNRPLALWLLLFSAASIFSCNHSNVYTSPANPLFTELSSKETGIGFRNDLVEDENFNVFKYRNYYNGGGVAIGDVNNDGLPDIYFTASLGPNKLYLNKGNWKFEDVTTRAGVAGKKHFSTGVAMVDINGDGLLDIYVCNSGTLDKGDRKNELFINHGNLKFTEEAAAYGLDDNGLTTHAAFFDYDLDGDLDCYILNNSFRPIASFGYNRNIRNVRDPNGGHRLLRNDNGHFTDVSEHAHIYGSEIGFGLGVSVADLNGDKWPDIYVSNDFFEKDYLYINQHDGTFKEMIGDYTGHLSLSSMGSDVADINNDGLMDIFTSEMLPEGDRKLKTVTRFEDYDIFNAKLKGDYYYQYIQNALHLNNGDSSFSEIAFYSNVAATDWSWGALMFDFENDGWKDILVCNGIYKDITNQDFIDFLANDKNKQKVMVEGKFDYKEFLDAVPSTPVPNYAYRNGGDYTFRNNSYKYGLGRPGFSNGAAYGDLDGDGDLDLVVNNVNMEAFVYRNNATEELKNNFLRVKLSGTGKNTYGIGSELKVYSGAKSFTLYQMLSRGFESSVDPVLDFGLGKIDHIDSLTILWPDHKKQTVQHPRINSLITLKQTNADQRYSPPLNMVKPWFVNASTSSISGSSLHAENYYIDFDRERLIPQLYSSEGPKCSIADVNGDGLEDLFIGGAKADSAKLFLQRSDGTFTRQYQPAFSKPNVSDQVGVSFFDADGDRDQDILIVYGGNEDKPGSPNLAPQLFLNDGKGNYTLSAFRFPGISTNASCVRAADIDNDGDMDVLIGGRVVPGVYGTNPRSYLLVNDGRGNFTDVTSSLAPSLQNIGMVTDAVWLDVNKDKRIDLIIVGEWMPVTIFMNNGNKFREPAAIPGSEGWWNCIKASDIDDDGDMDLVLGNLGLNSKIKGDEKHPVSLYVKDFDGNGQSESILCYFKEDSICYPLPLRGTMVAQMPSLKKRFLKYSDYAGKTIDEIFTPEQLQGALIKKADQFATCIALNNGKGGFALKPLPFRAQLSPVYSMIVEDLDMDGKKDILMGGNFFGVKPEIGRYDASYGVFLKGNGKGSFSFVPNARTGIFIKGEIRDIVSIKTQDGPLILFARNNETLQAFKRSR